MAKYGVRWGGGVAPQTANLGSGSTVVMKGVFWD